MTSVLHYSIGPPLSLSLQISNWLMYEMVFTENFEERVALLSRLVDIMVVRSIYRK